MKGADIIRFDICRQIERCRTDATTEDLAETGAGRSARTTDCGPRRRRREVNELQDVRRGEAELGP